MPETSSLSLYKIDETITQLCALREEVTEEAERATIDTEIQAWVERELQKFDSCYGFIKREEAQAEMAKEVIQRATQWRHIHEARAQRVRDMVRLVMEARGLPRVQGAVGSFTIRTSGGIRPMLPVDETLLPAEFKRMEISLPLATWLDLQLIIGSAVLDDPRNSFKVVVDTKLVRAALEAGEEIPGAKLGDRGTSLMVR